MANAIVLPTSDNHNCGEPTPPCPNCGTRLGFGAWFVCDDCGWQEGDSPAKHTAFAVFRDGNWWVDMPWILEAAGPKRDEQDAEEAARRLTDLHMRGEA